MFQRIQSLLNFFRVIPKRGWIGLETTLLLIVAVCEKAA